MGISPEGCVDRAAGETNALPSQPAASMLGDP